MKRILLLLTLGAMLASPAFAQSTNSDTPPPPPDGGPGGPPPGEGHHHGMDFLTADQKAEMKKAHDAAIAADPTLASEEQSNFEAMKDAHESGTPPTDDQKAAFHAFRDKMDAAMIKADPAVAPIIAEIKAHHHGGPGGPGGPPPPPPANT